MCRRLFLVSLLVGVWGLTSTALGQYDPHMVGWWALDEGEGTVAYDQSGHGNDGTFVNDPQWVSGVMGGALGFGGDSDDQVELTTELPVGSSSNTVALWIKVPLVGTENLAGGERVGDVLGNYADSPNTNWELHNAGQMRLYWNGGEINTYGSTDLRDNTWHHVAWVRDKAANACTMYIDGQLEATLPTAGTDITFTTTHRIGGDNRGNPPCFHGLMDDLQVYSRALSQGELGTIMKGPIDSRMPSSPQPPNEAVDVLRDVALGWSAGMHAAKHDVYFGTTFEDVNDGVGTLVSQGQTATGYDPDGVLEFGQTYYWRIDEVNGAPDNTVFKGDVWSFTIEPFAYPIEGVIATSNGISDEGRGLEKTVDGSGLNAADEHSTESADMWLALPGAEPLTLLYEFDSVYKLHEMLVWNYNVAFELVLGFGIKDVTVEYSADGVEWTVLGDVVIAQATATADYTANTTVAFDGVAAKYVRLTVNSGWGTMSTPQYGLSEVRFMLIPASAGEPQPHDGATDVSVETMLTWRTGREAVSHEVKLGTDPEALPLADVVDTTSYDPGALDLGLTYYWQVNEVNEADEVSVWPGSIWSFATQAYLVVDDFESYTDDINAGEAIFLTWIDGYEMPGNGSTVGNLEAPFAEQTIVKSGKQSMPLFYDNTGTSMSEATFTLAQNWTTGGVKSLSISFAGAAGNSGQLYVKVNGTKVAYDGAVDDLSFPGWLPWTINLSALGGNLSNVTTLVIGIEGAGASGVLYVDDIRLYPREAEKVEPVEPEGASKVGWWTFDDGSGSVARDHSGQGNDGTLALGELQWVPGTIDGALEFDGVRHQLALTSPLTVGSSSHTIATWIKVPLPGTENLDAGERVGVILGNYPDTPNTNWELHGDGQMRLHWNGGEINTYGTSDLRDNTWHHVAWVRDKAADAYSMYVDGRLEATHPSAGSDVTFETAHTIGGDNRATGVLHFHGVLDDLQMYREALSAAEVAWLAGLRAPINIPF